ncbi:MAG: endonuclease/exonuclease/phosphatase family protein [Rikenellaceae bacterium]
MKFVSLFFSVINYIITISLSVVLAASYFASIISPASVWWLSVIAIASPVLIIAVLITFLYNLVRLNFLAIVPLVVLIVGIPKINGQFNVTFLKGYDIPSNSIKIASHNVRVLVDASWHNAVDSTVAFVKKEKPDIIAFQEFYVTKGVTADSINSLFAIYPNYSTAFYDAENRGLGFAIFSKYPIVKKGKLLYKTDICGMQWVDVVVQNDTLRVFNIHMKSSGIDGNDKMLLNGSILSENNVDSTERNRLKNIIKKVKASAETRAFQADTISQIIASSPHNVVVCGDLNDVPFSYTYNSIKGNLNDTFKEKGGLFAYSYNQLYRLLKIDYIFTSKNYAVCSYNSFDVTYSDHNPIIVNINRKK